MAGIEDCTLELFDSSVFVEAIADTSGKQSEAKSAINSVVVAENRVPIVHELIVGEVKSFLNSDRSFEDEVSRRMAEEDFEKIIKDFRLVEINLADFRDELGYLIREKTRIASEFNDSLIVALALSTNKIDKIHTTDSWSLNNRDIKINSI